MVANTKDTFTLYDLEYNTGLTEVLLQNANVFNAASRNSIRLVPRQIRGEFEKSTIFKSVAGLVRRRDPSSVTSVTDKDLTQGELISVKLNRGLGPATKTLDAFRKIAEDPRELSTILGEQAGAAMAIDYLDAGIRAAVAASKSNSAMTKNFATSTITHLKLLNTLALFGDRSTRIVAWLMHSRIYYDLVGQAMTDKIVDVANLSVAEGITPTLGKPTILSDSSALISLNEPSSSASDTYHVLGLTEDALQIIESEGKVAVLEMVTGLDNLVYRWQGEHAFNVGMRGFAYSSTANPTDANLASSSNWSKIVTDNKDTLGVMLNVKWSGG